MRNLLEPAFSDGPVGVRLLTGFIGSYNDDEALEKANFATRILPHDIKPGKLRHFYRGVKSKK